MSIALRKLPRFSNERVLPRETEILSEFRYVKSELRYGNAHFRFGGELIAGGTYPLTTQQHGK